MPDETRELGWRWWRPMLSEPKRLTRDAHYRTRIGKLTDRPWHAAEPPDLGSAPGVVVGGPATLYTYQERPMFDSLSGKCLDVTIQARLIVPEPLPVYRRMMEQALIQAMVAADARATEAERDDLRSLHAALKGMGDLGDEPPGRSGDDWMKWRGWLDWYDEYRAMAHMAGYSHWRPGSPSRWLYDLANAVEQWMMWRTAPGAWTYETFLRLSLPDRTSDEDFDHLLQVVGISWRAAWETPGAAEGEAGGV
jgi:hypothetical protein